MKGPTLKIQDRRRTDESIGVVGLGAMGSAFARRFLVIGLVPVVYNRSPARVVPLVGAGAEGAEDLADLASRCGTIITVLGTDDQVRQAYLDPGGILATARPGTLLIDCSTVDPATSIDLGSAAAARGLIFADAGVGALPKDALEGRVIFMIGCGEEHLGAIEQALAPLAAHVIRCGAIGAGMTTKLVNNLLASTIHVADLEALALSERLGLDQAVMLRVLNLTAAGNNYLRDRVPAELRDREQRPGFKVDHGVKDADLGAQLAARAGLRPQVLLSSAYLVRAARELGHGQRSLSALVTTLRTLNGHSGGGPAVPVNNTGRSRVETGSGRTDGTADTPS